jgi:hypothetical protein
MNITNKDLSLIFFALFILFFVFFVVNRYTINMIMSIIMLQFSLAFKTWQLIREMKNEY